MMFLNLGCGYPRLPPPFVNVDTLVAQLSQQQDRPEYRTALAMLRNEPNYTEYDLSQLPYPWPDESADGILLSHYLEHWTTQDALKQLKECYRVLKPGGVVRISVPDAAYFRSVADRDTPENWMELYGEKNHVGPEVAYRSVALFFAEHLQCYTEDAAWCQLTEAGFKNVRRTTAGVTTEPGHYCARDIAQYDNRSKFSLYMEGFRE